MASANLYLLCLIAFCTKFISASASHYLPIQLSVMYPFNCSKYIKTCSSLLYQHNGLTEEKIADFYSVNKSQIRPISHGKRQDYLVSVPCSCKDVNGTVAYFYDTTYVVQPNDTFASVSTQIYSGQAWNEGGESMHFIAGKKITVHLLCGCLQNDSSKSTVVTYTVQKADTLSSIADLLSARIKEIMKLNKYLAPNPRFLDIGWLLYVPMGNSTKTG